MNFRKPIFAVCTGILMMTGTYSTADTLGQDFPEEALSDSQVTKLRWDQNASEIIGSTVISADGKKLGAVDDLVIGENGIIRYVIVSSGGLWGIGAKMYALSWDDIHAGKEIDTFVSSIAADSLLEDGDEIEKDRDKRAAADREDLPSEETKKELEEKEQRQQRDDLKIEKMTDQSAPSSEEPATDIEPDDSTVQEESLESNGEIPGAGEEPDSITETDQDFFEKEKISPEQQLDTSVTETTFALSEWLGQKVIDRNEREIGSIEDAYTEQGELVFVVIGDDNGKMRPVPAELIHKNTEEQGYQAEFTYEYFKDAPAFDKGEEPDLIRMEDSIYGYFGQKTVREQEH